MKNYSFLTQIIDTFTKFPFEFKHNFWIYHKPIIVNKPYSGNVFEENGFVYLYVNQILVLKLSDDKLFTIQDGSLVLHDSNPAICGEIEYRITQKNIETTSNFSDNFSYVTSKVFLINPVNITTLLNLQYDSESLTERILQYQAAFNQVGIFNAKTMTDFETNIWVSEHDLGRVPKF